MDSFEPVIGLEVHAQLITGSKMFCACSTRFGDPPNTHVCPVCLGLPGALPVLNARAVDLAVRAALALNCEIRPRSIFARKNYFYPDLPKGYQISQYAEPLAERGWFEVEPGGRRVGIARVHLEEDAGRSLHHGFPDSDRRTYLDFNRSGVPLVEIVTEPSLASAAEAAGLFARLRALLVEIGVTDGNMEEGSLRCDANVSLRRPGDAAPGVRTEVKNLNSFRYLQRALEFEIGRHAAARRDGSPVAAETRQWDQVGGRTVSMRTKESEPDYRYFREPDLGPLVVDEATLARARASLTELPDERRARLAREYGLGGYDADALSRGGRATTAYFEATVAAGAPAKAAANWVLGEVRHALHELGTDDLEAVAGPVPPGRLAGLIALAGTGRVSGPVAKDVFARMRATGRPAVEIVEAEGLARVDDDEAIHAVVRDVIAAHPRAVDEYRRGKTKTLGFLVGQAMKATGGRADPERVARRLRAALDRRDG